MDDLCLNELIDAIVASKKAWAIVVCPLENGRVEVSRRLLTTSDSLQRLSKFDPKEVERSMAPTTITAHLVAQREVLSLLRGEILPIFELAPDGVRRVDRLLNPIDGQLAILDAAARKRQAEGPESPYHC
ncbi:MAG TPA: hypothetical protein VJH69_00910 [Candidatus Paceibacterota bacterium]